MARFVFNISNSYLIGVAASDYAATGGCPAYKYLLAVSTQHNFIWNPQRY